MLGARIGKTMNKEVTLERLAGLVDAYGASSARWPADERVAAEALLAASAEARTMVEQAARFDMLLDMAPTAAPSAALTERLLAARPRTAVTPTSVRSGFLRGLLDAVWPYGSPAFPAGALAASIMLGVALGATFDISLPTTQMTAEAVPDATTGEELVSLALADTAWPEEWTQ